MAAAIGPNDHENDQMRVVIPCFFVGHAHLGGVRRPNDREIDQMRVDPPFFCVDHTHWAALDEFEMGVTRRTKGGGAAAFLCQMRTKMTK